MALKIGASLYRDGIVANGIQVVIRKWVKERNEIGAVFNDSTTVFAHVNMLADARNTDQCRKHLKLQPHVDMAIICTVTAVNSHAGNGSAVTVWICSDLQETSLKLTIYGSMPAELANVSQGTVLAVLNPDMNDISKDYQYRSISIKNCDNVLLIGETYGIKLCKGVTTRGTSCRNTVYTHHQGDFCKFHLKAAFTGAKTSNGAAKRQQSKQGGDMLKEISENFAKCEDKDVINNFVFKPSQPANPAKVLSQLGNLGGLMSKVMQERSGCIGGPTATNVTATQNAGLTQPCKYRRRDELVSRNKEFEAAVKTLKSLINTVSSSEVCACYIRTTRNTRISSDRYSS